MKNISRSEFAKMPPMGWNSWDCFSVSVTEEEVKQNADFMAKNLKQFGWEYIVVDLAWYAPGATHSNYKQNHIPQLIDDFGRLIPCPDKFPSSANGGGFKPLADYVHSLGLKFGIHIMRGIPVQAVEAKTPVKGTSKNAGQISYDAERCPWYNSLRTLNFAMPESQAYYDSIFELYASWGVDYIKADDLNAWHEVNNSDGSPTGAGSPYRIDDIEGISLAIERCGRPMVLSISPGGPETTIIRHLRRHTNLWRISADFWDEWGSLKKQMERCATWAPFITEGHWPDADMLPLGFMPRGESGGQNRWTNFTHNEQITVLTLWCLFRSPLMFGGNLPQCDEFTLSLLTNNEVLAVNQNSCNNRQHFRDENTVIWIAEHPEKLMKYVGLFNISEKDTKINFDVNKILGNQKVQVRDLWKKLQLGSFTGLISVDVPKHAAVLLQME